MSEEQLKLGEDANSVKKHQEGHKKGHKKEEDHKAGHKVHDKNDDKRHVKNAPNQHETRRYADERKHSDEREGSKNDYRPFILALLIIFLAFALYNLYLTQDLKKAFSEVKPATAAAAGDTSKVEVKITVIDAPECDGCFDISQLITAIKATDVSVTEQNTLDYTSEEAQALIARYSIQTIPSLIMVGDVKDTETMSIFEEKDGALVLAKPLLPYIDLVTGDVIGRVTIITLEDSSCAECSPLKLLVESMKAQGVAITENKSFDIGSIKAKELIKRYNITKVPAILLSEDAALYPQIGEVWDSIGTYEPDGMLVQREVVPPYRDLATGEIKGLVSMISLVDSSCEECYSISLHKLSLARFGVKIADEKQLDISSAEDSEEAYDLIEKYNITEIPTIILSPEAEDYDYFITIWESVGSIEKDGRFIFRSNPAMNAPYKDLVTGELMNPELAAGAGNVDAGGIDQIN